MRSLPLWVLLALSSCTAADLAPDFFSLTYGQSEAEPPSGRITETWGMAGTLGWQLGGPKLPIEWMDEPPLPTSTAFGGTTSPPHAHGSPSSTAPLVNPRAPLGAQPTLLGTALDFLLTPEGATTGGVGTLLITLLATKGRPLLKKIFLPHAKPRRRTRKKSK